MKKPLTFTVLLTLISLPVCSSSLKTVVTPFWQAPQISEVNLKIEPQNKDIAEECTRFRKLMVDAQGIPMSHSADRFSRFRSNPRVNGPWDAMFFETSFNVINTNALFSENDIFYRDQEKKLPYFYQEKAYTDIYLEGFDKVDFVPKEGRVSYSQMAKELGLPDSKIIITAGNNSVLSVKIAGKDIACDLLERNITLKFLAPATVILPDETKKNLGDFYFSRISSSVNKVISKKLKSSVKFGARLGGLFGEDLREEFGLSFDQRIEYIEELMDFLFGPNSMEPSVHMIKLDNRYVVNFVTSADAEPVIVNIGL